MKSRLAKYQAAMVAMALLSVFPGPAAGAEDISKQLWLDYNPSWVLSPKVKIGGDAGYRTKLDGTQGHRLVLRPGVDLPVKSFTLKAGLGNFWTISNSIDDRWEIRPYQGAIWVWPRSAVDFDHYVRLEERFDLNTVTWNSVNSLRARYRLRARYKFAVDRPDRFWRALGSGEVFAKLAGEEGLQQEQFRLTLGLERSFSRTQRYRFQIIWQQQELFLLPSDSADAIYFRLRFYQNF